MSFKKLILHIGRHKSGTSSLQHWLGKNRELLRSQSILYPYAGGDNKIAHHTLAREVNPKLSKGLEIYKIVNSIRKEQSHEDILLLSSEAFQNTPILDRLNYFISQLKISETQIICYVREHIDYAISSFRQKVQNQAEFVTFSQYCNNLTSLAPFFERWRSLGELDLNWYDRSELLENDIIADFCNRCEITAPDFSQKHINPSIGGNLLLMKLAANRFGVSGLTYTALEELAVEHKEFRSGFYVDPSKADFIRRNSSYNESLIAELGPIHNKDWSSNGPIPNRDTLMHDLQIVSNKLGIEFSSEQIDTMLKSREWFEL